MRGALGDRGLRLGRQSRGGHIDRLLEERTIERIGLVEQRQHLQIAVVQQPLECYLEAWNELLDQERLWLIFGIQRFEQGGQSRNRGYELLRGVGPNHAAAAIQSQWLDDTRQVDLRRQQVRVVG